MVATIVISILTVATIGICTGATVAIIDSVRADREELATSAEIDQLNASIRERRRLREENARIREVAGRALQVMLTAQRFANERKPAPYRLAK